MAKSFWSVGRTQYAENELEKLIQDRKESYRQEHGYYDIDRDSMAVEDVYVFQEEMDWDAVSSFIHFRDEIAESIVAIERFTKEADKTELSLLTNFLQDIEANKEEKAIIEKYYGYVLQENDIQMSTMREEEKCIHISRLSKLANQEKYPNMYKQVNELAKGMNLISHSLYNNDKEYTHEKHLKQTRENNFFLELKEVNFRALHEQVDEMCYFAHYKKGVVLLEVSEANQEKVINEVEKQRKKEAEAILYVKMDRVLTNLQNSSEEIEAYQKGFYENLPPVEKMINCVKKLIHDHPTMKVKIWAEKSGESPYEESEKNAWIDKHLPEVPQENRIFTLHGKNIGKHLETLDPTKDFLIDSNIDKLSDWEKAGGTGMHYKNIQNYVDQNAHAYERWQGATIWYLDGDFEWRIYRDIVNAESREGNTGYKIIAEEKLNDNLGLVMGENANASAPYVTSLFTEDEVGKKNYVFPKYAKTKKGAEIDFGRRKVKEESYYNDVSKRFIKETEKHEKTSENEKKSIWKKRKKTSKRKEDDYER